MRTIQRCACQFVFAMWLLYASHVRADDSFPEVEKKGPVPTFSEPFSGTITDKPHAKQSETPLSAIFIADPHKGTLQITADAGSQDTRRIRLRDGSLLILHHGSLFAWDEPSIQCFRPQSIRLGRLTAQAGKLKLSKSILTLYAGEEVNAKLLLPYKDEIRVLLHSPEITVDLIRWTATPKGGKPISLPEEKHLPPIEKE